ncbi:anthocyanidin-3-O-glucoside rhamnosyltransferase-like [Magnolia sinica]|uniref:anthocyanidin-3-O-glucoside rhamnosyltransferase-like n=1 Tax=Magnolia sinica TaxID=86752 RepID=UPI00265AF568|nr:anthocyanidin-3-O-glucoside rhamnosyltransferase-like [Magnolia sinica]
MEQKTNPIHIVMFPWLAFGHFNPFIQLSNNLSKDKTIKISFISTPANITRISSTLSSTVQIIPIKLSHVDGLPPGVENTSEMTLQQAELLKKAVDNMKPQIETLLTHLHPHIIFHDFCHQWLPSIATPLSIKTFFFSVLNATLLAYAAVPSRLVFPQNIPTLEDLKNPPPGFPNTCVAALSAYEARDLLYNFKNFGGPSGYERIVSTMKNSSAILLKTCMEMEAPYIEFFKAQYGKPVLLAGPVVPQPPTGALDQRWADWLDQFPEKSVIYCAFGSESFLEDDQIREVVLGLEMVGLPFLVVLNFPNGEDKVARLKAALPEGFEERVKDRAVVHTGWVPQQHILAHVSVGCFVSHAGMSSLAEALVSDCPLVLLPQKADQFLNSKLVSGDMKAAVEVKRDEETGYFGKEDLCTAVKAVTEWVEEEPWKTMRENHRKWRDFLRDADVHENYFKGFVEEMKGMVYGDDGMQA